MKDFLRILLLAMMVCCWGCSSGGEDDPTPTPKPEEKPKIEVTTTAPVLAQEGETASVTFTSSEAWTLDVTEGRAVSWCSVSPTSGGKGTNTLTINTTANDTYDERNAKVTIKAGTAIQSFVITQKQMDGLTVTSNKVEVDAEGGSIAIEVKANVQFEYEIEKSAQSWIASDGSRALKSSTLSFKVAENEQVSKREGKITIRSGELSETVTVYQYGSEPVLVLTQNEYTLGSEGGTIKVELKSNVDYEVQLPDVGWVREIESRAMSASTHYFEVLMNDEYDSRTIGISFVDKAHGIFESVTINQAQKDAIIIAEDEYTVESSGGELGFGVDANVDYQVLTDVDWIKQNSESTYSWLNFTIAENEGNSKRTGTITLKYKDLVQTVTVIQNCGFIIIDKNEYTVEASGGELCFRVDANVDYQLLTDVDWIKQNSKSTYSWLNFTIAENEGNSKRTGTITLKYKDLVQTVTVIQDYDLKTGGNIDDMPESKWQ